jgi:small-conductance mechanosensitive channel
MKLLLEWLGIAPTSGAGETALMVARAVGLALFAWLLLTIVLAFIRRLRIRLEARAEDEEQRKRVRTVAKVSRYFASIVIIVVIGIEILNEFGVSMAPLLGAAGVAGIAIGFGAQSLVKDYFTGFTLLIENQIRVGDVIEIAGKSGLVEEVTLRYVRLRAYDGTVHFVPTGEITIVTNMTRQYAYALMDIGVAYKEDLEHVFAVMRRVAGELRATPEFRPRVLEDIEIAGVEQWAESAVVVRARIKVVALEQWAVRREYLLRLKQAFDREKIEIPFPHVTVYAGADPGAAPMPLTMVGPAGTSAAEPPGTPQHPAG